MTQHKRVMDFDNGVAMVVTDLHGAGKVYDHLRDKFLALYKTNKAQRLILCGDLIHGYGPEDEDDSLRMLLDVMRLQSEMGRDKVVLLMGNHEMPHVYGIHLMKGDIEFTPRFERALVHLDHQRESRYRRKDVLDFLRSLPLYVRTKAGVFITHAGATPAVTSIEAADFILNFDHDALLKLAIDKIRSGYDVEALKYNAYYLSEAKRRLAIDGPDDPRLLELLRAELLSQTSAEFQLLWEVLFATNEQGWTIEGYSFVVKRFLELVSALSKDEQRVMVAGHIQVKRGGYVKVGTQQLRIASYAHATPQHAGCYLLLDCAKPVSTAAELILHLRSTFAE